MAGNQQDQSAQFQSAIATAKQRYPWLRRVSVPMNLTIGEGPGMSESYDPHEGENPFPGTFTVQLRDPEVIKNQDEWAPLLGREGIDYIARHDPIYQAYADRFQQLMSPRQLDMAHAHYGKAKREGMDVGSFNDFLKDADLQEWLSGYVLNMPDWRNAPYTPDQRKLLDGLKQYLWQGQISEPVNIR